MKMTWHEIKRRFPALTDEDIAAVSKGVVPLREGFIMGDTPYNVDKEALQAAHAVAILRRQGDEKSELIERLQREMNRRLKAFGGTKMTSAAKRNVQANIVCELEDRKLRGEIDSYYVGKDPNTDDLIIKVTSQALSWAGHFTVRMTP